MMPDDTVFICSDCDEIANPKKFDELIESVHKEEEKIVRLSMSMHYGRADRQLVSPKGELFDWRCGVASTVSKLIIITLATAMLVGISAGWAILTSEKQSSDRLPSTTSGIVQRYRNCVRTLSLRKVRLTC